VSGKSVFDRLESIPREIIYAILLVGLCYVLVNPIGLPIKVTGETRELYDLIEGLPENPLHGGPPDVQHLSGR